MELLKQIRSTWSNTTETIIAYIIFFGGITFSLIFFPLVGEKIEKWIKDKINSEDK